MNTLPMLIRREFWEHRSLWLVPAVFAALMLVFSVALPFQMNGKNFNFGYDGSARIEEHMSAEEFAALPPEAREAIREAEKEAAENPGERRQLPFEEVLAGSSGLLLMVYFFTMFFYALDCLLSERRDRSILFWKSLPISDAQVVLSKVLTGLVVAPFAVYLIAVAAQLLFMLGGFVGPELSLAARVHDDWSFSGWIDAQGFSLKLVIGASLWYAPLVGYLLVVSVWARRNAFLWAVLLPVSALILENIFLSHDYVGPFLRARLGGFIPIMTHPFEGTGTEDLSLQALLASPILWVGLGAAAALYFAAARIRRYRDDS